MNDKDKNDKFPILSVRVTAEQMDYLRREAAERELNIPKYVRKVLFPFEVSTVK